MADLSISPAEGNQATTQNPQTVPDNQTIGGASTQSGGVQPGTATTLLTSRQGISLQSSALTAVNLSPAQNQTQTQSKPAAKPTPHHVSAAAISIPVLLCLAAVILFLIMNRSAKSAKNTTD